MFLSYHNPAITLKLRYYGYFVGEYFFALSYKSRETVTGFLKNIREIRKIRKENELLKKELDRLLFKEKNYYQEIQLKNQRLQKLLEFKKHTSYKLIPVELSAYSPQNFFKTVYINKGRQSGVKKGMGVVNVQGLVGRVVEVYSNYSKVLLIVDKRSKVGVRVQRTRDIGILQGKGSPVECELLYILNRADVKKGDRVVTSGLGGLFPSGILVGYISDIKKNPGYLFQRVIVKPAVDFGKLEELFLVVREE